MHHWPTAMIRPKSQKFKLGHDGMVFYRLEISY
jgi:hypothetical protein